MSWSEVAGDPAAAYARQLLNHHGVDIAVAEPIARRSTIEDWAGSGAMALTGLPDGPPQLVAGAPATTVRGALLALGSLAMALGFDTDRLPDERALGERAAAMRLTRGGRMSAGGACRLLDAADGTVALTLSRPDDLATLPALLEVDAVSSDPWTTVAQWCRARTAGAFVERAALLGLAASAAEEDVEPNEMRHSEVVERRKALGSAQPFVVDLSSLWAGPFCAHLLGLLGARVIAVESTRRPDPTAAVAPEFHRMLRQGTERLALDFANPTDIARLRDLLSVADIVVEASRPRALAQLGVDAEAFATTATWISITAYGRDSNRIGYGDDVAAAAGLLGTGPVFAGDAIADPMTGAHAAVAALARWTTQRTGLVEVAMYDVARAARTPLPDATVVSREGAWFVDDGSALFPVVDPAMRQVVA